MRRAWGDDSGHFRFAPKATLSHPEVARRYGPICDIRYRTPQAKKRVYTEFRLIDLEDFLGILRAESKRLACVVTIRQRGTIMTTIKAQLSSFELETRYEAAARSGLGRRYFHALWLLSSGYEVDEVAVDIVVLTALGAGADQTLQRGRCRGAWQTSVSITERGRRS